MKYYIIAGEASGDLHGSNLIKALKIQDAQADIRAWGGDMMAKEGAAIVKHYKDLAFMGFIEVVMNLKTILTNLKFCKSDITAFQPDILVLIDYPGFNLRIAEWAKKQGIKVVYYISPQIWAWKENRIHKIKASVDKMIVILPFEKDFYKKHNMHVDYVGHPLTEVVDATIQAPSTLPSYEKPVVALLPGSRTQEINTSLPIMMEMVKAYPQYQFIIAQAPSQPAENYNKHIAGTDVQIIPGKTYDILKVAKAALVTSGTATLETALFSVPQIVCYKGNPVSYWLARKLIKVKYISLVNLILDKPAVLELIQHDFNLQTLQLHFDALLNDAETRDRMFTDYAKLWELLGDGKASAKAADIIVHFAKKQ